MKRQDISFVKGSYETPHCEMVYLAMKESTLLTGSGFGEANEAGSILEETEDFTYDF